MNRVIVLVLCLASAAGIAGYTYLSKERGEPTPVYVVPQRSPEPKPAPAAARHIDPADQVSLARALQRELKRVGCYGGEITGRWTASSRTAMKAFTERVNASLPVDKPDPVLLSLVQGHRETACGTNPSAPQEVAADPWRAETRPVPPVPAAVPPAPIAPAARPVPQTKPATATDAPQSGPVPPEGMREKRIRRSPKPASQPPKWVRDALRTLGL
jgi:hypothetical protein